MRPHVFFELSVDVRAKDLEKYWARTVKGKWVGKWAMSRGEYKLSCWLFCDDIVLRMPLATP